MADMQKDLYDRYKEDATKHGRFLCDKVFMPAFEMAFVHGAKHMFDEMSLKQENGMCPKCGKPMVEATTMQDTKRVWACTGDCLRTTNG
jgi:hypothetical protein